MDNIDDVDCYGNGVENEKGWKIKINFYITGYNYKYKSSRV